MELTLTSTRSSWAARARVPEECIPCGLLARAMGYPEGYTRAERTLWKSGWFYSIGCDAWIAPPILKFYTGIPA